MSVHDPTVQQDDPVLRDWFNTLAKEHRRYGYRLLHVFLRRAGHEVNHTRLLPIYREDGGGSENSLGDGFPDDVARRRRGGRKRAIGTGAPMVLPLGANQKWSLDCVSDQMSDGRRFRILTVVDDCTRKCRALIAATSLSGARVARELGFLFETRGKPLAIVNEHGTAFTSSVSKASAAACATNS